LLGANAQQVPLPRLTQGNKAIGLLAGESQQGQELAR
jgi:hypothetical protein